MADTGVTLNRTSYNTKQEVQSYRIGVLNKNVDIRNQILQKNIGKYAMFTDVMFPAIGEAYEFIKVNNGQQILGPDGILGYSMEGDLGQFLTNNYKRNINNIDIFSIINPDPVMLYRWKGKYDDYLKYVSSVYGHEVWNYDVLNNILASGDIKHALFEARVGVVRNVTPVQSMAGSVVTNINNFSGLDTSLGLMSNQLYARTLIQAANFNTIRNTQHITPNVYDDVGMNLNTVTKLNDLFNIKEEDFDENGEPKLLDVGRLSYVPGENNTFLGTRPYYPNPSTGLWGYVGTDYPIGLDSLSGRSREAYNRNNNNKIGQIYENNISRYGFEKLTYSSTQPYIKINDNGEIVNIGTDHTNVIGGTAEASTFNNNVYNIYKEGQKGGFNNNDVKSTDYNGNTYVGSIFEHNPNSLLSKTAKMFNTNKIGTLVGRFYSSDYADINLTQTAVHTNRWGISHGRNLLKKNTNNPNNIKTASEYENPYCRVWTYHHQYDQLNKLIRPFVTENDNGEVQPISVDELQKNWKYYSRHGSGAERLVQHSVLGNNGFVKITPTKEDKKNEIKKYMFSLENMAWKDVIKNNDQKNPLKLNLSNEQIGPLGGRIMWFPPYDIKFSENINVDWSQKSFLGRGEPVYTYTDTVRSGMLSFTLLVDHPSILNYWKEGKNTSINKLDDNGQDMYENEILRFFAGCDTLEIDGNDINNLNTENKNNKDGSPPVTPEQTTSEDGSIIFYVYFPNNYSGYDDLPNSGNSAVSAPSYILVGTGTQKDDNGNDIPLTYPYIDEQITNGRGYEMNSDGISTNGYKIKDKWMYRVDNILSDENLAEINYNDNTTFKLNMSLDNQNTEANYTFAEVFTAFNDDINLSGIDMNKVGELKTIFDSDNIEFKKIKINGMASSHGLVGRNTTLAKRRADSVYQWLLWFKNCTKHINKESKLTKIEIDSIVGDDLPQGTPVANLEAKKSRSVRVEIQYGNRDSIKQLSKTNTFINTKVDHTFNSNTERDSFFMRYPSLLSDGVTSLVRANGVSVLYTYVNNAWVDITPVPEQNTVIDNIEPEEIISQITDIDELARGTSINAEITENRYDEEYQFFSKLDINAPTMRSRIMDKIQYFDPAFHSITPEGFTNRLGFLHQCTRQGHTISASDGNGYAATAGNMSFGRPPVCVLRVGDFYNTKIIINSVNIDFDPMQWDLNPEGIGVQPMMAKINISFNFLGGSDLGGPIARLQNAVTFNYYANQAVFDNRADIVEYNSLGEPEYVQWNPENTVEPTYLDNDRIREASKTLKMNETELSKIINDYKNKNQIN